LTARTNAAEAETARLLGSGNASRGIRIALQIARQHQLTGALRLAGALKASELLDRLLPLVRDLEAAATAEAFQLLEQDDLT